MPKHKSRISRNKLIIGALSIVILLGIIAPFLASSEPDGLEATLEKAGSIESEGSSAYESPMPDYTVPFLGDSPLSLIMASLIGIVIVFILAYGLGILLKKRKNEEKIEK